MLPGNVASDTPDIAPYLAPYNRPRAPLEDFEDGGIALNDGSQGLSVQTWQLTYDEETDDFTVRPESVGPPSVVLSDVPDVTHLSLAWNQNMDVFIAYEQQDGSAKYYWYDTAIEAHTTSTLPAGSRNVEACMDDHRLTQTGASDIILAYIRAGSLYYRQERDRFSIERLLATGVGSAKLLRVGMTRNNRLKFEVRVGRGDKLCDIIGDICIDCGLSGAELDLEELCETYVRGYRISDLSGGVEFIRSLQRTHFFDLPLIDGKLVAMLRGRPLATDPNTGLPATITIDDMIAGEEPIYETGRELEVEFARKLHLVWSSAETDYGTDKATSEIRSPDRNMRSENTIQTPVNFESEEANQRVDIMHKQAIMELNGRVRFEIPDNWAWLTPGDPVMVEVRDGVFRRIRIQEINEAGGALEVRGVHDRASVYSSIVEGVVFDPPTPPPANLPGQTTWEYLDLPSLGLDTLHWSVAAHGDSTAWFGAAIQRQVETDWITEGQTSHSQTLGVLDEALGFAPAEYTDTTNSILVTTNKTLFSVSQDQLYAGANRAAIGSHETGWEIIQFRDAVAEGDAWRLSFLLRGRKDTTAKAHSAGAKFVLLDDPEEIEATAELISQTFNIRVPSLGTVPSDAQVREVTFTGRSQREWAPVNLTAEQSGNDWNLSWIARYRLGSSHHPLPSVHFYGWRVRFTVGSDTVVKTINSTIPEYTYSEAEQSDDFGSAQASFDDVEIRALNHLSGPGNPLSEAVS